MNNKFFTLLEGRANLPYRRASEAMIKDSENNVYCLVKGHYIKFPGGGIDKGEKPIDSVKREVLEETGIIMKDIKFVGEMGYSWTQSWASTDKQKERYKQYKGAYRYWFLAKVDRIVRPTSTEGDSWEGLQMKFPLEKVIRFIEINLHRDKTLPVKFRRMQLEILYKLRDY